MVEMPALTQLKAGEVVLGNKSRALVETKQQHAQKEQVIATGNLFSVRN